MGTPESEGREKTRERDANDYVFSGRSSFVTMAVFDDERKGFGMVCKHSAGMKHNRETYET